MRLLPAALICLAAATSAHATGRIRDSIILGGRKYTVEEGPSIRNFLENDSDRLKSRRAVWLVRNDALHLRSAEGRGPLIPARSYSGGIIVPAGGEIGLHQRESRLVSDLELYLVFEKGKLLRMEARRSDPEYVPVFFDNRTLPLPGSARPKRSFTWKGKTYPSGAFPEPAIYLWEGKAEREDRGTAEFVDSVSISFFFDEEPLKEVVKKLSEMCKFSFRTDLKKASPKLTLRVKDMPMRLALDRIAALTQTTWHALDRAIVFREDTTPFGSWTVRHGRLHMGTPQKFTGKVILPEGREIGLHVPEGRVAYAREIQLIFRDGILEKTETVTHGPDAAKSRLIAPYRNETFRGRSFTHAPTGLVFPPELAGLARTVLNESVGGEGRIIFDGGRRRLGSEGKDTGGGICVVYEGEGVQAVVDVYRGFDGEPSGEEKAQVRRKVLKSLSDRLTHFDLYTGTKTLSKGEDSDDPLTAAMALARGKKKYRTAVSITIAGRDIVTVRFTAREELWERAAKSGAVFFDRIPATEE